MPAGFAIPIHVIAADAFMVSPDSLLEVKKWPPWERIRQAKDKDVEDHPWYNLWEPAVSESVDLGQNNNPNTTPTKDYENVRVVVYLRGVQRGCAEEGERGSTPTGRCRQRCRILLGYRSSR